MRLSTFFSLLVFSFQLACAQAPAVRPGIENDKFDQRLSQLLNFSVPVMGVAELNDRQEEMLILDARPEREYAVSHIPGARHVGYETFKLKNIKDIPKDQPIVLYCSVGYRSEKIGERLQEAGYTQVYNLYGSLFEWANRDFPLEDEAGQPTLKIHTYDRNWSQWVEEGRLEKVW
ncbi:MAG: rhodanese-like domain-containing protein [Bacteroidota bacterium]